MTRAVEDAQRTAAEFARTVEIPVVMRLKADMEASLAATVRVQWELAASLPSKEILAQFQASLPSVVTEFQAQLTRSLTRTSMPSRMRSRPKVKSASMSPASG
jgi:hypothetical protein